MPRYATALFSLLCSLILTLGAWAQGGPVPDISVHRWAGVTNTPAFANAATISWDPVSLGSYTSNALVIKNTGSADLTGITASISGICAAEYSVTTAPKTTLGPGYSNIFYIQLSPAGSGPRPAVLTLASNDPDESPFILNLNGSGPAPDISVELPVWTTIPDGGASSFGKVHTASSSSLEFHVRNRGTLPLTGLSITKSGANTGDFVVTQALSATEIPGNQGNYITATFTVTFTPGALGPRTATLHIASNDPDENPSDIQLSGEGIQPQFVLEDENGVAVPNNTLLDFGSVAFLSSGKRDFTIRNTGATTLSFSNTEWVRNGNVVGGVSGFSSTGLYLTQVLPGATKAFTVTFAPYTYGQYSSTLRILSDDVQASPFELNLTGLGLRPALRLDLAGYPAPSTFQFGGREVGSESELTFTISNRGNAPLTHSVAIVGTHAADYTVRTAPQSPLGPNQSTTFTIVFTPQAIGTRMAYLEITHDGGFGPQTSSVDGGQLYGWGVRSKVSFSSASYTASHGDSEAVVTLKRSPSMMPVTVQLDLTAGTAQAMPPFESAIAGTDYTEPTGAAAQISFAAGEAQKTVSIPLLAPAARASINRRLNLALSNPSTGAELWAPTQAVLTLLGKDSTKPTLTLDTPAGVKVRSTVETLTLSGKVGDAKGISSLTLKLNGAAPVPVPLGSYAALTSIPFELVITPLVGQNEITLTAVDPRGNTTALTRSLTFVRLRQLNVRMQNADTSELLPAASFKLAALPAGAASTPAAVPSEGAGKVSTVESGAQLTLAAICPKGYVISHWEILDGLNDFTTRLGNDVTLTMPDGDVALTAWLIPKELSQLPSQTVALHALLDTEIQDAHRADLKGYLAGTLSPTGTFTGKFQLQGKTHPVNALCHHNALAVFIVAGKRRDTLPVLGGKLSLTLQREGMLLARYSLDDGSYSSGTTELAPYSSASKVPSGLLNSATQGYYTVRLEPQFAELKTSARPRGYGYATARLTTTGQVTVTGLMPDGTAITCATVLLQSHKAPVYIPLLTPGSTSAKGGLVFGSMEFVESGMEAGILFEGILRWFRPAAVSPKVLLYPAGWPSGINLGAFGLHYDSKQTVQAMLELDVPGSGTGNASLRFMHGKLTSDITKESFNIVKNGVVKITPADGSYTLTFTPATGLFSGTFTPNWSNPGSAKPAFKGVILQKSNLRGGHGFFINNARGEIAPESGVVLLGGPLQ